jgi:ATP-dependent protease ClpP protease subunit
VRVNLQVANKDSTTAVIELYEFIDPFWGFGAVELSEKLKELTAVTKIVLKIHSRGGNAMEGFAIFSLLQQHPAVVEAEIIGVAASAASVVAMAANTIKISEVGFMMIHDPWAFADGNKVVLRRVADMLEQVEPAIVRAYANHASLSALEIQEAMAVGEGAGTWYDAEAAVSAGLADEVMTAVAVPENQLRFDGLVGVPQAAIDAFMPQAADGGNDPLLGAILDEIRSAPTLTDQPQGSDPDQLIHLIEDILEDPNDA